MDTVWGNTNKLFFKVNPSLKFLLVSSLFILYLFVTNLNTMIWTALLFFILYFLSAGYQASGRFGL